MDTARFEELKAKADGEIGLTREEADELGRLYAEEKGEPYANADDRFPPSRDEIPQGEQELIRREEEQGVLGQRIHEAPTYRPASPADLGELEAEEGMRHAQDVPYEEPRDEG